MRAYKKDVALKLIELGFLNPTTEINEDDGIYMVCDDLRKNETAHYKIDE